MTDENTTTPDGEVTQTLEATPAQHDEQKAETPDSDESAEKERLHRIDRRNKQLSDRVKELESKLSTGDDMAKRMSDLEESLKQEQARAEALRSENVRKDIYERALDGVPNNRRESARVLLRGLTAETDLNSIADDQVAEVASKLRSQLHKLDSTYLSPVFPSAVNSSGEVDWSQFGSWGEVPRELRKRCPQNVYEERFAGGGAASSRSRIFGSRS